MKTYLVHFETYNYYDVVRVEARNKREAKKIVKNYYGTATIIDSVYEIDW